MTWFRKWMILSHRYLGIALCLLIVVWFISGIAMMYAGGMPGLTPETRLDRLPLLDLSRVEITPTEAVEQALLAGDPERAVLLTVMARPAYRFSSRGGQVTVFADSGEVLVEANARDAVSIAGRFTGLGEDRLRYAERLTEADQWTITVRDRLPMHKVVAADDARTELYVSEQLGEVVVFTTRGSRALAWVAAIPHWLYFAPLRLNGDLWRQVVLWTSGLGCVLILIGLVVGILQFSPSRPFRITRLLSSIPYTGWMRWHYITGVVFGVFSLTWVFSGMLSMEPLFWSSNGGLGVAGVNQAFSGGPLEMSLFSAPEGETWGEPLSGERIKEIEFRRIQGEPYYVLTKDAPSEHSLVAADSFEVRHEPFSTESLVNRVQEVYPDVPIVESRLLSQYDSYYYARDQARPLPVLRVKFDDPDKTWFYIDPAMGRLESRYHRLARLERWIYHGFHSLDFAFLYYNQTLWEITVIVLSLGGIMTSGIGVFIGFKRLGRNAKRALRS